MNPTGSNRFVVHHVGGRAGTRGFPVIAGVEGSIVSVLYDADAECADQIVAYNDRLSSETIVLPYCLGNRAGRQPFFLTYDPYVSSLLEPKADSLLWANDDPLPRFDYPLREALAVVRTLDLDVRRLDEVCEAESVPPPDFISLDVQGAELSVLEGLGTLMSGVVGVLVEVEFQTFYENQPLFPDVHEFLTRSGLTLVALDGMSFDSGTPLPIGLRAHAPLAAADALYLRPPDGLLDDKIALCALAFGYSGWAMRCTPPEPSDVVWREAVREFHLICQHDSSALPRTFSQHWTLERSFGRFVLPDRDPTIAAIKRRLRKVHSLVVAPQTSRLRRVLSRRRLRRLQRPYRRWATRWGMLNFQRALDDRLDGLR